MIEFLTYFFGAVAFTAATFLLFSKNILYAALALVVVLVSTAGLFVLFHGEFVAIAQLMIYVGGIIVLLLFTIMLTSSGKDGKLVTERERFLPSLFLGAGLYAFLAYWCYRLPAVTFIHTTDLPIESLGMRMLLDFLLPLELVAVLLLVVLIGTVTIARNYFQRKSRPV